MHKWIMIVLVTFASLLGVYLLTFGMPEKPVNEEDHLPEDTVMMKIVASSADFSLGQDEFRYKVGDKVIIKLENKLGTHGVKIDELDVDLTNDQPLTEAIEFKEPGEYIIYCSIACGSGHSTMTAKLIIDAA